jgi:hypothetical protein
MRAETWVLGVGLERRNALVAGDARSNEPCRPFMRGCSRIGGWLDLRAVRRSGGIRCRLESALARCWVMGAGPSKCGDFDRADHVLVSSFVAYRLAEIAIVSPRWRGWKLEQNTR